jgi:hypothetical protein
MQSELKLESWGILSSFPRYEHITRGLVKPRTSTFFLRPMLPKGLWNLAANDSSAVRPARTHGPSSLER